MDFDSVAESLGECSNWLTEQESTAGMWVMFPAYRGGGEKYGFKFVKAWQNLEEQGIDGDNYARSGWQKANEPFADKLTCDSSRVHIARNRRMAEAGD